MEFRLTDPLRKRRAHRTATRFHVPRDMSVADGRRLTLPAPLATRPPPPARRIAERSSPGLPPEDQPERGPAQDVPDQFRRKLVDYVTSEPAGTVIIDTPHTYLYLVLEPGKALRYGVGVGREGFHLDRHRAHQPHERMAGLASAERNDRAPALSAAIYGWRRRQPAWRTRPLSRQHRVSHSRHQSAVDHRTLCFLGLHPLDQRRRRGPLQQSERWHACRRSGRLARGDGVGTGSGNALARAMPRNSGSARLHRQIHKPNF